MKHAVPSVHARRGVVLLVVLMALILIATALAGVARQTSAAQIAQLKQQRGLQQRWGMLSCERAVLPAATGVFLQSDQNAAATAPRGKRLAFPSQIADQVILGGQSFQLILGDEGAKANLNAIYDAGGQRSVERSLQDLLAIGDLTTVRLQPRRRSDEQRTAADAREETSRLGAPGSLSDESAAEDDDPDEVEDLAELPPALASWGEVFDYAVVKSVAGDVRHVATMTKELTLWGGGRLNVWRASDDAILAVAGAVVEDGLASRLLQRLRGSKFSKVDELVEQEITNQDDRERLQSLLSDTSVAASLWIEASDGQVRRERMTIQQPGETGLSRTRTFHFP